MAHQDMVAEHLAAGRLIRVAMRDDTTEYELLAESVDALRMDRALPTLITPEVLPESHRRERPLVASASAPAHEYRRHTGAPGRRIGGDDSFGDTLEFGRLYG